MTPITYEIALNKVRRRDPYYGVSAGDPRDCAIFGEEWEGEGVRLTIAQWDALGNPGVVTVTVTAGRRSHEQS